MFSESFERSNEQFFLIIYFSFICTSKLEENIFSVFLKSINLIERNNIYLNIFQNYCTKKIVKIKSIYLVENQFLNIFKFIFQEKRNKLKKVKKCYRSFQHSKHLENYFSIICKFFFSHGKFVLFQFNTKYIL